MKPSEVPEEAVHAVAEVLYREYDTEFDASRLSWKDFTGEARKLIVVAVPHIERQVRERVAAEAEPVLKDLRKAARTHHYLLACEGTDEALVRLRAVLRGES